MLIPARFSTRTLVIIGVAIVAIILFAAFRLRGTLSSPSNQPAPLVQSVLVSGRMANQSRVFLGSTITGRVREVKVREGRR